MFMCKKMKSKFFKLCALAVLLGGLDQLASLATHSALHQTHFSHYAVKAGRAVVNGVLAYMFYLAALRIIKGAALPRVQAQVAAPQILLGGSLGFFAILACVLATPEFYAAKSVIGAPSIEQLILPTGIFFGVDVIEEVFYRGILQPVLASFMPFWLAAAIQVAAFVAGHDIAGHADPVLRIISLAAFGLVTTVMARRAPFLLMPIFFHLSITFFLSLLTGGHEFGWPGPGIWNYFDAMKVQVLPIAYILIVAACWCWPKLHPTDE
jgi:membrane protease YdiL (CAAX protease family)